VRLTFGAPFGGSFRFLGRLLGLLGRPLPLGLLGRLRRRALGPTRSRSLGGAIGGLPARRPSLLRRRAAARPLAPAAGEGGLAEGADGPARIDRLAATRAGVLEPLLAGGAAQIRLVDRVLAVGAAELDQLLDAQLRRPDLELPFVS